MSDDSVASRGGGFLVADLPPSAIVTPEQFTEEHTMMGRVAEEFVAQQVLPKAQQIEKLDYELTRSLLREAGKLGLLGADVPEAYGGLGLSKVASTLITEKVARSGSFAVSWIDHVGIGTLPIVFFGNEEQRKRHLPKLATGERLSAYALTEPDAGSDAQGIKTTARLAEDGKTYRLKGQKQFITSAGFADMFVVYAKVDGDKTTAFMVERNAPGLTVGPEIQKMGIHGSSTCMLFFEETPVPVENVLGEIGRGHIVAFNILNIGRWKLACAALGSSKYLIERCARYASERRQFGKPIGEFPAIQQKLAAMAARTFALESMVYRTAGLLDKGLSGVAPTGEAAARAIGEYAVEASINKVFGSETLHFVADEAVQLHGGYGYSAELGIERAYRDSRINRIWEGTNEVNRLLVPGTLMRRAMRGELPLLPAVQKVQQELTSMRVPAPGEGSPQGPLAAEAALLANLKKATLAVAGLGAQKYMMKVEEEQEFLLAAADLVILTFALESAVLRAQAMATRSPAEPAMDLARLFADWAADQAEVTARRALAGMEQGDTLEMQLGMVRRLFRRRPVDTVAVGRRVARRALVQGGYGVT